MKQNNNKRKRQDKIREREREREEKEKRKKKRKTKRRKEKRKRKRLPPLSFYFYFVSFRLLLSSLFSPLLLLSSFISTTVLLPPSRFWELFSLFSLADLCLFSSLVCLWFVSCLSFVVLLFPVSPLTVLLCSCFSRLGLLHFPGPIVPSLVFPSLCLCSYGW